jgi:pilus assembly protein CpaC
MYKRRRFRKPGRPLVVSLTMVLLLFPVVSWAVDYMQSEIRNVKEINLFVGKSVILRSIENIKRVSVAAPEIADLNLISRNEVYLTGKAVGVTNLTLWKEAKAPEVYELVVSFEVSRLKQKLHDLLPNEKDLRVIATHNSITLAGTVSSSANLSQVMAVTRAFVPEDKIVNSLQVAGIHQVMLEVRVAEMSRSLIRRLGVNFTAVNGDNFAAQLLGGLTGLVKPADALIAAGPLGLVTSSAVNALFRFDAGGATWTGFLDALKEDGLIKILAEPTLISMSGQQASFLAGGEFPVPQAGGLGTTSVVYKKFGVELSFTPLVLSESKISIKVHPSVSELDFTNAVLLEGFVVPGLNKREAVTMVELADGQSFAIAGLLQESVRDIVDKFPLLGDIPILGALFRSRSFQKRETELIIIVTPHLVKPLNLAEQTLPTDYYIEPNDIELYLLNLMEGRKKALPSESRAKLDGEFGHALPVPVSD